MSAYHPDALGMEAFGNQVVLARRLRQWRFEPHKKLRPAIGEGRQVAGGMSRRILSSHVKPLNDAQSCPHLPWGPTLLIARHQS